MIKYIKKALFSFLLLLIGITCLLSFFLTTTPGLYTIIRLGKLYLPGSLEVHQLKGRIYDEFSVGELNYKYKNTVVKIKEMHVNWRFFSLLQHQLVINQLTTESVEVKQDNNRHIFNTLHLTGLVNAQTCEINEVDTVYLGQKIKGKLQLDPKFPNALTATLQLNPKPKLAVIPNGVLHIAGNLAHITWNGDLRGPIALTVKGSLKNKSQLQQTIIWRNSRWQINKELAVSSPEGRIDAFGILPALQVKLATKINNQAQDYWQISADVKGLLPLHWDFEANMAKPSLVASLPKGMDPTFTVSGKIRNKNHKAGGKAQIESNLAFKKTNFALTQLGINVDSLDLAVLSKNNYWEITGSLASAGKKLLIKGRGPLGKKLSGDLQLEGTDFSLMNTREYLIKISPQLKFTLNPNLVQISGSVLVPEAQIKPESFSNSQTLSQDVVYKRKPGTESPAPFNTSMDVKLELGKNVELTTKGLHANLSGAVQVQQQPMGTINATGEFLLGQGQYKAYGQDLAIEQGQLIYTGGRIDNPEITLKASKIIDNSSSTSSGTSQLFDFNTTNLQNVNLGSKIKVGVEVSGRLTAPQITLFSNPAILSQSDILSMLVLGRPASQANKAGAQLLLTAITSMNIGGGTNGAQLLEQLKQSAGIDFNVQTSSNYNQKTNQMTDSTAFVVGKSLSKKLYLSYNVGLSQADPNVLTLKYLLNKFFSLQVSSSESGSGVDLLYSRSKDKINE